MVEIRKGWDERMAKIILIYASMSGNTEEMADAIAAGVREAGEDLTVMEVMDANAADLSGYDGILLGAYTWGDGELPYEFLDFYDDMEDLDLSGTQAAVFGSCDSCYAQVGKAVDILMDRLRELGSGIVQDGLKVELTPSDSDRELCRAFGRDFAKGVVQGKALQQ